MRRDFYFYQETLRAFSSKVVMTMVLIS